MAMWKIWNCQTLHKSLEITNAVHVTCVLRTLVRRLNDELINVCGQSLKLFLQD